MDIDDDSEISIDNRGWKSGKSRKYTPETKQICMDLWQGTYYIILEINRMFT